MKLAWTEGGIGCAEHEEWEKQTRNVRKGCRLLRSSYHDHLSLNEPPKGELLLKSAEFLRNFFGKLLLWCEKPWTMLQLTCPLLKGIPSTPTRWLCLLVMVLIPECVAGCVRIPSRRPFASGAISDTTRRSILPAERRNRHQNDAPPRLISTWTEKVSNNSLSRPHFL